MNSSGVLILAFFGAVFAALGAQGAWHWRGAELLLPFAGSVVLGVIAYRTGRRVAAKPLSPAAGKALIWATASEIVAILVGANLVVAFGRSDWVLPVTALAVGAHFLPIGWTMPQPAFTVLGATLIGLGAVGLVLHAPANMALVGFGGCAAEWLAACWIIRLQRLRGRRRSSGAGVLEA